jgi:hypothetical protein
VLREHRYEDRVRDILAILAGEKELSSVEVPFGGPLLAPVGASPGACTQG